MCNINKKKITKTNFFYDLILKNRNYIIHNIIIYNTRPSSDTETKCTS